MQNQVFLLRSFSREKQKTETDIEFKTVICILRFIFMNNYVISLVFDCGSAVLRETLTHTHTHHQQKMNKKCYLSTLSQIFTTFSYFLTLSHTFSAFSTLYHTFSDFSTLSQFLAHFLRF